MNDNELKIEVSGCHQREAIFKKVTASKLQLNDEILKHQPKTKAEENLKKLVEKAIKEGLKDFWRPVYDPSFDDAGCICYEPGKKPAVGMSYNWWEKIARNFCPERGSRLGTKSEYVAFLAVLIKELVASGKSLEWAWNAVCNDSKELGHYWNSKEYKNGLEPTGSRAVCGWCDLGNTYKILAEYKEPGGFWFVGGDCNHYGFNFPLAVLCHYYNRYFDLTYSCGWLVFDRCPDC